jgi:hypothetical protein
MSLRQGKPIGRAELVLLKRSGQEMLGSVGKVHPSCEELPPRLG